MFWQEEGEFCWCLGAACHHEDKPDAVDHTLLAGLADKFARRHKGTPTLGYGLADAAIHKPLGPGLQGDPELVDGPP